MIGRNVTAEGRGFERTVLIVGGGPAGLACGLELARAGVSVTVVERCAEPPREKIGESLAPSAVALLQQLGLDDLLSEPRHLNSPGLCSSWGHEGLAYQDFIRHPHGHGWHLDRAGFERDLRQRAIEAGCGVVHGSVQRVTRMGQGWCVHTDGSASPMRCGFVVDSTGRSSVVARMLGVRKQRDDLLVAWYGFLVPTTQRCSDATAMVEAVSDGWYYLATLPNGTMVAAFMTDPDLLPAAEERTCQRWLERLAGTTEVSRRLKMHDYRGFGLTRVVAADSAILEQVVGEGWAACGDAAASYDPLSSHGIATALATGRDVAAAIRDAFLDSAAECSLASSRIRSADSFTAYADRVRRSFEHYRYLRREYYEQETRWPTAPFWQRRQGNSTSG